MPKTEPMSNINGTSFRRRKFLRAATALGALSVVGSASAKKGEKIGKVQLSEINIAHSIPSRKDYKISHGDPIQLFTVNEIQKEAYLSPILKNSTKSKFKEYNSIVFSNDFINTPATIPSNKSQYAKVNQEKNLILEQEYASPEIKVKSSTEGRLSIKADGERIRLKTGEMETLSLPKREVTIRPKHESTYRRDDKHGNQGIAVERKDKERIEIMPYIIAQNYGTLTIFDTS